MWWHNWAVRSRLQATIKRRGCSRGASKKIITYLRHHITYTSSESINVKVKWVKYTTRGFRNKRNFIHAIYFHCGGFDLAPQAINTYRLKPVEFGYD